jgi:dienelactone hydrolase
MGTIILIITFVTEAAFATYCILTKSNQERVQSFIRIGAFAAFVLFTLVSVIQWSFRWYLLAALLLVWAVLGAWTLVRKKEEKKEFRAGRTVLSAIGTFLLVLIVLIPALIFPQYTPPKVTGKHAVATANYTYTDKSRIETFTNTGENRKVNVEFWYPKDAGIYPLIVFSHGAFGIKISNTSTFKELASNGYVVCSIDHPYHSLFTVDTDGHRTMVDRSFLQEVIDLNAGKYDEGTGFKLQQKWMNLRIADINFVLDTILTKAKDIGSGAVYQMIDRGKIGLMGHSLGGESSAQVARERNDIGAVVNLDSDLHAEFLNYVNRKYVMNDKVYPVPLLNILTDTTERLIAAVPDAKDLVPVEHVTATAPNAYEVHLTGTDHMSVTDLPLISPFFVSIINASVPKGAGQEVNPLATIEKMNDLVLKFFNAFLKGEGSFTASGTY